MTRKKFVKLLMSQGVQRNMAQRTASAITGFTGLYNQLYTFIWFIHETWSKTSIPETAKIICCTWARGKTQSKFYYARGNGRHSFPWLVGIDLASGPDQTALHHVMRKPPSCTMEGLTPEQHAAAHGAATANNHPDSGAVYWYIMDSWEVLTPIPVTIVKDSGGLLTVKWQVTEDHAEKYEEIHRNQLYASEAEAWRVINEGR